MNWITVCKTNEIAEEEPKAMEFEDKKIGVFMIEERFFAVENVCPHAFALLTEGFIEGFTVECPLHEAIFNLETGALESGPGCRNLSTYLVRVENGEVQVQL
ncbi:non-heme iron oxygenase ferredoxin subunit [Acinetobacter sichuanensis]|uniref:Non-heme iron oxygenase ferredoxin subunit n=1 Tax=Acinetobacter sichuanensis TaxID=2136183 RepID=A0A371YPA9_9GAMM|nr:non-heme iron oxygenase ferredoxin subunit [Acinetobacter sichuanensis]RFC83296.1 non-heme iron oxygenase ferredoxin subunit [Acinetobacter sichuanensis]